MRTIKEDEELETLVKVGDIVRLEGFTDEPIMAIVTEGKADGDCSGCVLVDSDVSCSVSAMDHTGAIHNISLCCLIPTWMNGQRRAKFGRFKELEKVLEDL